MATSPLNVHAVSRQSVKTEQKRDDERRMDSLSMIAYGSVVAGLASLFLVPVLGLLLIPGGLVMGLLALFGGKNRYEKRKGRGLAFAAVILGGAFTVVVVGSLLILLAFGF